MIISYRELWNVLFFNGFEFWLRIMEMSFDLCWNNKVFNDMRERLIIKLLNFSISLELVVFEIYDEQVFNMLNYSLFYILYRSF